MHKYNMIDFLARSTDRSYGETTLASICNALGVWAPGPNGPWLAGGAVRKTLLQKEPDSDFDFFFKDEEQLSDFESHLKDLGLTLVRETIHHKHYRGRIGGNLERDIQLIRFKYYASAEEVIDSFDFTICQVLFDGTNLYVGQHTLWDLGRRKLAVHKITFPVSSMRRLLKYTNQGFTACNGCLKTLVTSTNGRPELDMETTYVD